MTTNSKFAAAVRWTIKVVLPLCLVMAGLAGFRYYKASEVKMKRQPPVRQAVAVETIFLNPGNYPRNVHAMGTVVPDRQVELKSKVGAEVVFISDAFVRGGVVKQGQVLIRLDDADYKIEVKKAQSALEKAQSDFDLEKGSQEIAREEHKLINKVSREKVKATDLALRKPQLVQARAAVESAGADLERALLNLERTKVTAPFNSLVLEKNVSLGSLVSAQATLATLVDIDTYSIEVQVSPDRLGVIRTGQAQGSRALVKSQYAGQTWDGIVSRTTGRISDKSRMAGVLVTVQDPLGLKSGTRKPALVLGDHVDVTILGQMLDGVFALPRAFLRDADTVWVLKDNQLEIKKVSLAWKEDGVVYVNSGIGQNDALITSDLAAPVRGMALQKISGDRS